MYTPMGIYVTWTQADSLIASSVILPKRQLSASLVYLHDYRAEFA